MTVRRGTAIATSAAAAAVAFTLATSSRAETAGVAKQTTTAAVTLATARSTASRPPGVLEDCSTQSAASFPGGFTKRRNLVVGPLSLSGAGGTPVFTRVHSFGSGGQKFPVLVMAGHRVTVELSRSTRLGAGLAYGPRPPGQMRFRDAHRVVTFIACGRSEGSRSRADGQPVTFWPGGVVARSPRCVPVLFWVDAEPSPRRAVIRLGVRDCG